MSRKKKCLGIFLAVCLSVSLVLSLTSTQTLAGKSDKRKKIVLRYADTGSATSARGLIENMYLKRVEEMSKGRVEFVRYWSQSLLKGNDMLPGTGRGVTHVAEIYLLYAPKELPLNNVSALPGGKEHPSQIIRTLKELWEREPLVRKEWDANNVVPIWWHASGLACIVSTKPIRNLEDLKGLDLRASGGAGQILKAWGANLVAMPMPETPEALQKGVVQGLFSSLEVMKDFKFAEFCRYVTITDTVIYPFSVVMNLEKWNSLPSDVQEVMDDLAIEQAWWTGNYMENQIIKSIAWSKENYNIEIIKLTKKELARWNRLLKPIIDKWIKDAKAKGFPARAIVRDIRVAKEYHSRF